MVSTSYIPGQWNYFIQFLPATLLNVLWRQIVHVARAGHTEQDLSYGAYCEKIFDVIATALIPAHRSGVLPPGVLEGLVSQALCQAEYSYRGNKRLRHKPFERHAHDVVLTEVELTVDIGRWKEG